MLAATVLFSLIVPTAGQWEVLNRGIKGSLNSIDFVDDQTGWLAGRSGNLISDQ